MPDLIYRLVLREDLLAPEFASLALRSRRLRNQIEILARGSSDTMPKLAQGHIKSLRIPLPPREDQEALVERADALTRPLKTAIERTAREVALLAEFRSRLVADVVTGQVDVRTVATSLPEIDVTASWGHSGGEEDTDAADFDGVIEASEV